MSTFAEPDGGFKPAAQPDPEPPRLGTPDWDPRPAWHDDLSGRVFYRRPELERLILDELDDRRCGICNARPFQPHLAVGTYP